MKTKTKKKSSYQKLKDELQELHELIYKIGKGDIYALGAAKLMAGTSDLLWNGDLKQNPKKYDGFLSMVDEKR